jgi:DnaJ-domain-containing protein 1
MGIWSRLGTVIKSYLDDQGAKLFGADEKSGSFSRSADPDLDAAFDELNDYLNRNGPKGSDTRGREERNNSARGGAKPPPEELRPDFAELGVPFGAAADECKAAYKRLLKIHHPDRHAGHEGNFKKATEKSARINAAWDRIEKWRKSGG